MSERRAARLQKIREAGDIPLPEKITAKDLKAQALKVRQITESRDPVGKRSAIRRYITAMEADSERRIVRVLMHPLEVHLSTLGGSAKGS